MTLKSTGLGVLMAASLVLGVACTDEPGLTNNGTNNPRMNNPNPNPPAGSELKHVGPTCNPTDTICSDSITVNSERKLKVQLFNGDGSPVSDTEVLFEVVTSDADEASLTAARGVTNGEGIAETALRGGGDTGSVKVKAFTNDPNVDQVEFIVSVNFKGAAAYNVTFREVGDTDFEKVDATFYASEVTCAQVAADVAKERDNDPTTNPSLTAQVAKTGAALADGSPPVIQLANIMNGVSYTVAAKAYLRGNDEVEVAFGCIDMNPAVEGGQAVDVEVPLLKNLPKVTGTYRVVHTFDLRDGLPDNVKLVVDLLGTLVSDPGAFIVGCEAGGANPCPVPTDGLVSVLLDVLPENGVLGDLRGAIEGFLDSSLGREVVRSTINDALDDFLKGDKAPDWLSTGINITQDIYETLSNFEVQGIIRIKEQPAYAVDGEGFPVTDAEGNLVALWSFDLAACRDGAAENCNEQIWENISFYWRKDCDANSPANCGKETIGATTLGGDGEFVKGYFNGSVSGGTFLNIDQHTLKLNYGLLILTVVEKVVLPSTFGTNGAGQPIDSIERLLDYLLASAFNSSDGCEGLANQIGTAENVIKNLCGQLLSQAGEGLRKYMTEKLVANGEDSFLVSTMEGCALKQPEVYQGDWPSKPLPYAEGLGTPEMQCKWDVNIKFSENNSTKLDGVFHGTLQ